MDFSQRSGGEIIRSLSHSHSHSEEFGKKLYSSPGGRSSFASFEEEEDGDEEISEVDEDEIDIINSEDSAPSQTHPHFLQQHSLALI